MDHHNREISNTRYVEKVFATIRQKLDRPEDDQRVLDQKVNAVTFLVSDNERSDSVRHHAETDLEPEARDQARLFDSMAIYSLDEIYFATWQSD